MNVSHEMSAVAMQRRYNFSLPVDANHCGELGNQRSKSVETSNLIQHNLCVDVWINLVSQTERSLQNVK